MLVANRASTQGLEAERHKHPDRFQTEDQWNEYLAAKVDILMSIADELVNRTNRVAELITMENGKPLAQARGEVAMAIGQLSCYAEDGQRRSSPISSEIPPCHRSYACTSHCKAPIDDASRLLA